MLTKTSAGLLAALLIGGAAVSAAGCGDDEGDGGAGGAGGAPATTSGSTSGTPTSTSGMMTSSTSTGGPSSSSSTGTGSSGSTSSGSSSSTGTGSSASTGTGSSSSTGTGSSSSTGTGSSSSSGSSSSATSSTSTGMMLCELPDTTDPTTCAEACSDLYDCGALVCDGMQNCPGVTGDPAEKAQFVPVCVQTCMSQMALIALIDPSNCDGTVATLSALNAQFDDVCQNGLP